jgi:large subunit ribosomal protein L17
MLANMAVSLIMHKRIKTTVAKAKALRQYIEPILTKSKTNDTHSRRMVFSYLQDKESVSELFNNVADKISSRPGGYTRIIKTGARLGDNAEMCMMELVDFNDFLLSEETAKPKTRRSRRGKSKSKNVETENQTVAETQSEVVESAEDSSEEVSAKEVEDAETTQDDAVEEATDTPEEAEVKAAVDDSEVKAESEDSTQETPAEEKEEDSDSEKDKSQ